MGNLCQRGEDMKTDCENPTMPGDKPTKKEKEQFDRLREESIENIHKKEYEELGSIIKLIQDLRKDSIAIVEKYTKMLMELAEMQIKLYQE